jgi:Zn-dependent metalloprotease
MRIYTKFYLTIMISLLGNFLVFGQKQVPGKPYNKSNARVAPKHANSAPSVNQPATNNSTVLKNLDGFATNKTISAGYYELPKTSALQKTGLQANQKVSLALAEVKDALGINSIEGAFLVKESSVDDLGMSHIRFSQQYQGVEVWGGEMILHDKLGKQFLNGSFFPEPSLEMTYAVTKEEAMKLTNLFLGSKIWVKELSAEELFLTKYAGPKIKQVIYPTNGKMTLCWFIETKPNLLSTWRCFIDANTGAVLNAYNQACTVDGPKTANSLDLNGVSRSINTYEKSGNTFMIDASRTMFNATTSNMPDDPIGAIWTVDAQNTYVKSIVHVTSSSNSNWPSKAVSAHYNAGIAYEYYKNTHARNSINGSGGTIISVINVTEQNGQGMDNAFWTGEMMCYGNGKDAFKPLAGSLDVAGHEMTHGVVQNTANLEYQGQSGAMNESMADIFACMMDRDDWLLGDDVVKIQYFPTGALRSLQDPHNGGNSLNDNGYQPKTMSEYYAGTEDNGGVHINSGIPNWAFYKFATAVTKDKAEKVYYRALSKYLTKTAKFVDLRIAVVQSCIDLYGDNSAEYNAAKAAFNEVGIYATDPGGGGGTGGGGTNTAIDLPINPGQDYLLSYDDSSIDPVTLYQSSTTGTNYIEKSRRAMKLKPSVTDDGSFAVFVGTDSKIYKLTLGTTATESVISSEAIWDNVAVSKDGKRIAAITTSVDSAIYVYDFTTQIWQEFKLYNPTYTTGVETGSVLYANALEFDYSGERVVYDARNIIENASGADIDFWDIGYIQVWNNASNTFGNGKIEKLYTQLPKDVNIGNPSFAKNSPYILAFDYIDVGSDKYAIIGKNMNTNTDDVIVINDQVGYPSYSKLDNKIIYDATTSQGQKWLAVVGVEANKITGKNDAAVVVPDAYWGNWYSVGKRSITSGGKDILAFSFPSLNPPVTGIINGTNIEVNIPFTSTTDFSKLIANFTASAFAVVKIDTTLQVSGATKNNFTNSATTPVIYTLKAQDGTTKSYQVRVNSVNTVEELLVQTAKIYPIPASTKLTIEMGGTFSFEIYDLQGKLVEKGTGMDSQILGLNQFENGLYMLHLKNDKSERNQTILIQH